MTQSIQNGRDAGGALYSLASVRNLFGAWQLSPELARESIPRMSRSDFIGDDQKIFDVFSTRVQNGRSCDESSVVAELGLRHGNENHWATLVGGATFGVVAERGIVERHEEIIHELTAQRRTRAFVERLVKDEAAGRSSDELRALMAKFATETRRSGKTQIRKFEQITDIMSMDIPPIDYVVDGLIARGTLSLWAGSDGVAKTFMIQRLAVEVARGGSFLGRSCKRTRVLFCDFENPAHAVRERIEAMTEDPIPNLKIWGNWLECPPPRIGDESLLEIAREVKPLVIFDPFVFGHTADENSTSEMAVVMQHLRHIAATGAAVVIVHHVSKAEGSGYRGSSSIRGACDLAVVQEQAADSGLLTLSVAKNRFGPRFSMTVRPDYDLGTFEVADSPAFTQRQDELESIAKVIRERPGLTQNELTGFLPMAKQRAIKLVKSQTGILWETKTGPRNSLLYYPLDRFSKLETSQETTEPLGQKSELVSWFSPLKGETTEPVTAPGTGWTEDIV